MGRTWAKTIEGDTATVAMKEAPYFEGASRCFGPSLGGPRLSEETLIADRYRVPYYTSFGRLAQLALRAAAVGGSARFLSNRCWPLVLRPKD